MSEIKPTKADEVSSQEKRPVRQQPRRLSLESMNAMVESLCLCKIRRSQDAPRNLESNEVGLSFDFGPALSESKVPMDRLTSNAYVEKSLLFSVRIDDDARLAIGDRSVYGGQGNLPNYHRLTINSKNQVELKLQRILAAPKNIGEFTPELMQKLQNKASMLIYERDANHDNEAFMATVAIPKSKSKSKYESKSEYKFRDVLPTGGPSLQAEIASLSVVENTIRPPIQELAHFPDIKKLMLRAGGTYKTDRLGSFFDFPEGLNASDILQKLCANDVVNSKADTQFFATPRVVGVQLMSKFPSIEGKRFLEPSAGEGALADLVIELGGFVKTIENWPVNIAALKRKGYSPLERDFLTVSPQEFEPMDGVVMNPPFSNNQYIKHVKHALGFLNIDGNLCAIVPPVFQHQNNKETSLFRDLMKIADGKIQPISEGAFKASGTDARTVMISINMEKLIKGLRAAHQNGSEYGLDLEHAWKGFVEPKPKPRP